MIGKLIPVDTSVDHGRRTVLRAAAGLGAVAAGAPVVAELGLAGGPNGRARAFDTDDDGETDVSLVEAPDPAGGGRPVRHATSRGVETSDYVASLARVADDQVTLGDMSSDTTYDYYRGRETPSPGPDEVWIVLTSKADGSEGLHALFRTLNDHDGVGEWRTRDVASEVTGTSDTTDPWKEFHVDDRSIDTVGEDLTSMYGEDAKVKWAGVGRGSPGWESAVLDTYYRSFTVAGDTHPLPTTDDPGKGNGGGDDGADDEETDEGKGNDKN